MLARFLLGEEPLLWLVHSISLLVFTAIAGACAIHFRKFWLKGAPEAQLPLSEDRVRYAVLMTVLLGAVFVAVLASVTFYDFGDPP